ncbi:hypothetical protein [Glaciihabitans sp. UYNi722]|uniref:hypothetical protein n=1 Tax=Glaciihabitans sp. UYNi722 TaxID=3156344 RepID=UPI003394B963
MPKRAPLPEAFQGVPFSRQAALEGGISAKRLRGRDLRAEFHGVRAQQGVATDLSWRCFAYTRRLRPGNMFSHLTAARLYGLPLPLYVRPDDAIQVCSPAAITPPYGVGIRGHRLAGEKWRVRDLVIRDTSTGEMFVLPVASPELVWAQLASTLDIADLIAVGDAILAGGMPLATIADLTSIAGLFAGSRGSAQMTAALPRQRVGSRSRTETLTRLMIVDAGLPEPELNIGVHDLQGGEIATADLVWRRYRTLSEYEGNGHRSPGKFRSDITRFERYADNNWSALRVHADDLFVDPNLYLARLGRRLSSRGWPGQVESRHIAPARR